MHQMEINYNNHSEPLETVPNNQLNESIANSIEIICSKHTITADQPITAPANSAASVLSNSDQPSPTTNRTYLQCYSREANKNLVSWADQMSIALRDSVAHLDQICMRVRSCLSDLEANEIRYLHMQRRPSPIQMYQPPCASSLLQPVELYTVPSNCQHLSDQDQDQMNLTEMVLDQIVETKIDDPVKIFEPPIEIESLPPNTPIIVEPVEEHRQAPRRDIPKRPKSRRSDNSSREGIRPSSRTSSRCSSITVKPNVQKPAVCRKIASAKTLKPIISVREHLELTKNANSSRQVYKKVFRANQSPSLITTDVQTLRLPTAPQISRPRSILKVNKFITKTADITVQAGTTNTVQNTTKNKDNQKFNDSLWFKDKNQSQAKLHDHCGCKVIVECPRVPIFNTPRASYNAQSRLQWIRAKNSLVLEYGKQHAADNASDKPGTPRHPVDILDAINDDLIQPLKSEYPRKDSEIWTLHNKNSLHTQDIGFGGEDNNQLLKELLQDPTRLKGLVRTSSRRVFNEPRVFPYPTHLYNPRSTPVKQNGSSTTAPFSAYYQQQIPLTNAARLQRLRAQNKRKQQNKRKALHQQKQEELVQKQLQNQENKVQSLAGTGGDSGDLITGRSSGTAVILNGKKSKRLDESGKRSTGRMSTSGSSINGYENKENVTPTKVQNWSHMSPSDIKMKLMPFLFPNERVYTILPVTEIIYERKPPVTCLPPTMVTKGKSLMHLNSSQQYAPNKAARGKPRSLYTDVKTQRKLDSYLELRDTIAYPKPTNPTIITTFPAVTVSTPATLLNNTTGANRHAHHRHRTTHPRRQYNPPCIKYDYYRGTVNPPNRRNVTASDTTSPATDALSDENSTANGQPQSGCATIDTEQTKTEEQAKKTKTAISAATRRDLGSSIQQLEDKIAELISDPNKIGNGKAFDDVEQDIVRMLKKLNMSQEQSTATTTDDLIDNQFSLSLNTDGSEDNMKSTISQITLESAIALTECSQFANLAEVLKKSADDTIENEPHHMEDISELKQDHLTPMEITAALNKVEENLSVDQDNNTTEQIKQQKSTKRDPWLQPIYEQIEPISTINKLPAISKEISQMGTPKIAFKIDNIPEYASVDSLSLISDFPYVANIKKQQRDDSPNNNKSVDITPQVKKLKRSDGTSCKPEQNLIVSTDNLCSIEGDQFVTPFMKVVRRYRQEETHDNFMQFLEALTELSQDNTTVFTETKNVALNITEINSKDARLNNPFYIDKDIQQLNAFYKDFNEQRLGDCLKSIPEKLTLEFAPNITNTTHNVKKVDGCKEVCTDLTKTDSVCSQLIDYILHCCDSYVDKHMNNNYNGYKCESLVTKGTLLRFVYTLLFAVVFMALKWNWDCTS